MSFARTNAGDNRDSFSDYFVPNVEVKDFDVLIDGKSFFDLPVKHEEEFYEKLLKWVAIIITQLIIYKILVVLKKITN